MRFGKMLALPGRGGQRALRAGRVPREHFQPSGCLPGKATQHMKVDKKRCLPKPGFKNDYPVSSQACVGQTPLPLKVLHSSCFGRKEWWFILQPAVAAQRGASIQMLAFLFAQKTLGKTKAG